MAKISPEFEQQLQREIGELFAMIDINRDGLLSPEEVVKFV
jgi:Ca2+-binding EF-hand superfamily protein